MPQSSSECTTNSSSLPSSHRASSELGSGDSDLGGPRDWPSEIDRRHSGAPLEGLGTPPTSVVALTRSKSEATRSKGFLHACSSVTGFGLTKTRDIGALSAPKRADDVKGDSLAEPSSPARRMRKVLAGLLAHKYLRRKARSTNNAADLSIRNLTSVHGPPEDEATSDAHALAAPPPLPRARSN